MSSPMFFNAEGNAFNEFAAGPADALNRGLMMHDQTVQHRLSAHPEGAYLFQCGTGDAQSYGLVGNQTLQHQWGDQPEAGSNIFPVENAAGHASSLSMINELHQLQISIPPGSAVNVENSSQIFPTPELPRTQPSLKTLKKREADKRYRAKEKQLKKDLTEENKRLNNKYAQLKKRMKQRKKELDHNKHQNNKLAAKIDELSKAVVTCQICNDSNHIAAICPQRLIHLINPSAYMGVHTLLQAPSLSNSDANHHINLVLGGLNHLEPCTSNNNLLIGNDNQTKEQE